MVGVTGFSLVIFIHRERCTVNAFYLRSCNVWKILPVITMYFKNNALFGRLTVNVHVFVLSKSDIA